MTTSRFTGWRRGCRDFLLRDIGRKSIALLLAVLLYFYVSDKDKETISQTIANVPVTLVLPPDAVCEQGTAIAADLRVHGPRRALDRLSSESFSCKVSITKDISAGEVYRLELTPDLFPRHRGVKIETVTPSHIDLSLDRMVRRSLPIRPVREDLPPAGYTISAFFPDPNTAEVSGPSLRVAKLQQVETLPVPINGNTREGFDYTAELRKLDGISISPEKVSVHVEIDRKASGERSLSGLQYSLMLTPVQCDTLIAEPAPGAPKTAEVVVRGPEGKLKAMKPDWIRLFADLSSLRTSGEYTLPLSGVFVDPEVARELEIIRISPEKLRVIVRPRDVSASRK